jgi:RNA polymerase sigma-70 factor (ECF subfamily)
MLSGLLTPNGGCNQIRRDALVVREFQEGGRTVQIQNTAAARSKSNVCSSVPLSDDALVKAVAAGNRSAMCTLYDRHNMRLYRFIFRIVPDAGRAKELVSEVFIDETALERLPDSSENPEQAVLNKDCSAQVRACLAQMSRNHREIIDLVYYQDKSVEEAAKITHMPKNTVKTRIYYARKILGRLLSAHPDFDRFSGRQAA